MCDKLLNPENPTPKKEATRNKGTTTSNKGHRYERSKDATRGASRMHVFQESVLEHLWHIDMRRAMCQLARCLFSIGCFKGKVQLSGEVLLEILNTCEKFQ